MPNLETLLAAKSTFYGGQKMWAIFAKKLSKKGAELYSRESIEVEENASRS